MIAPSTTFIDAVLRNQAEKLRSSRVAAGGNKEGQSTSSSGIDWAAAARKRLVRELAEAGRKQNVGTEQIEQGLTSLETLLPGFMVNLEALKASDWVTVVTDPSGVALRVIALKRAFPTLDVAVVLSAYPRPLAQPLEEVEASSTKVADLLKDAADPAAIIAELPQMLSPQAAIQVLVTLQRWFPQKDPIGILEKDADIIKRAQANDVPLEPVFFNADGSYAAPQNTRQVTQPWQEYIREKVYKQKAKQPVPKVPPGGRVSS